MEGTQHLPDEPIDLAQFDEAYAAAPADDMGTDDIIDGKFRVNVEKVELTRSQTSGNAMLKWTLKILGPCFEGRKLWRNNVLVSDDNIKWLKADLKKCGLELEKLSDLPARLSELLDVKLLVTKKTNGEFMNVYINKRVTEEEATEAATREAFRTF